MARALSIDLRERVLRDALSGDAIRSIASRFEVSASFVSKLHKRYRETGSVEPARQGGDRWSHLIEAHAEWILQTVEGRPDVTLREIQAGLLEQGLHTSTTAVHNFLHRHGLSFKKRQHMLRSKNGPTL